MASKKKTARSAKTVKDLKPRKKAARNVKGGLQPIEHLDRVKNRVPKL
jgi:hypothetical protein